MVELSSEGDIRFAEHFTKSYAGDTFNTAVAAARLGSKVVYITRTGNDVFAMGLQDTLSKEGISVHRAKGQPTGFTGLYFVTSHDDATRDFVYYRKNSAASLLGEEDIDEELIKSAKVVFSSGITLALSKTCQKAVMKAFKIARENNVMTAFDLNFRPGLWDSEEQAFDALNQLLPYIDIVMPSVPHDTKAMIGLGKLEQVVDYFWFKDVKLVVAKTGSDGCYIGYKRQLQRINAEKVKAVDSTGAGDAFNGGFLHGLSEGKSLVDCARLGTVTAGFQVQNPGTIKALPRREQVYAKVFAG